MSDSDPADIDATYFSGTYEQKLDEKGRLVLPSKFRDAMRDGLFLTRGQENCLYLYPAAAFYREVQRLRRAPQTHVESRIYKRLFNSGAYDQTPDKQGRVTVPAKLRDYAGITREIALIGNDTHIELWDENSWDSYLTEQEEYFATYSAGGEHNLDTPL